jgi:hypothetical protein
MSLRAFGAYEKGETYLYIYIKQATKAQRFRGIALLFL